MELHLMQPFYRQVCLGMELVFMKMSCAKSTRFDSQFVDGSAIFIYNRVP